LVPTRTVAPRCNRDRLTVEHEVDLGDVAPDVDAIHAADPHAPHDHVRAGGEPERVAHRDVQRALGAEVQRGPAEARRHQREEHGAGHRDGGGEGRPPARDRPDHRTAPGRPGTR